MRACLNVCAAVCVAVCVAEHVAMCVAVCGACARVLKLTVRSCPSPPPGAPPLPTVELPLPRPLGRLRTTFCDEEMRLSRGGRGGIFVLKKIPS